MAIPCGFHVGSEPLFLRQQHGGYHLYHMKFNDIHIAIRCSPPQIPFHLGLNAHSDDVRPPIHHPFKSLPRFDSQRMDC